jgi:hypothetical protein
VSAGKHTEGPWAVTGQSEAGRYIKVAAHGRTVARVLFSSEQAGERGEATDASDALLIAAAPDMLAALCAYDDAMTSCWGAPDGLPPGNPDAARCWPMARAAIAKARGQ